MPMPRETFPSRAGSTIVRVCLGLLSFFGAIVSIHGQITVPCTVEIDLRDQAAYLIREGRVVMTTPIASGRYGHLTPTGSFTILEKERNHLSSMYGKIVDARGNTVVSDADADMS